MDKPGVRDLNEHGYFGHVRRDVLAHLPANLSRVLSIGCGAGATEEVLVRQGVTVVGIEYDSAAAAIAAERGIEVHCGDAMQVVQRLGDSEFDAFICADVLEHLPDPEAFLEAAGLKLASGAMIVISVPNFRSLRVFRHLFVRGVLPREGSGIFDRTHLQVTTLRRVGDWFKLLGGGIQRVEYRMNRRSRLASVLSGGCLRELLAIQLVVSGVVGEEVHD